MSITEDLVQGSNDDTLSQLAAEPSHSGSIAALWMLLLLRLTSVATDQRVELRNSAIQTLMRIISAYGDSLSPEAWSICVKSIIFQLLSSVEDEIRAVSQVARKEGAQGEWNDTAVVVVQGVSGLFATYLGILSAHQAFADI